MLQMLRLLKSSRSRHSGTDISFGGTTHVSPSFGKQSKIAFPNGRYGTSYSRSKLSCSASLLSVFPRALTKCPSGYLELTSHLSIDTRIFCPRSDGAWRVRRRIRGSERETGCAKTD